MQDTSTPLPLDPTPVLLLKVPERLSPYDYEQVVTAAEESVPHFIVIRDGDVFDGYLLPTKCQSCGAQHEVTDPSTGELLDRLRAMFPAEVQA